MQAHAFENTLPTVRIWVRGVWWLANSSEFIGTAGRVVPCEPGDVERALIALDALPEELAEMEHTFYEGQGRLVEVLGTAHGQGGN